VLGNNDTAYSGNSSTTTLNGAGDVASSGSNATLVVNGTSDNANGGDGSHPTVTGNSDTGLIGGLVQRDDQLFGRPNLEWLL
jgi:hypothetical protein